MFVAINTKTGEVYAMKEIPISQGDLRALRKLADELRIFEGIKHKNLVRHYGVEIHKEEMLIFMEYCSEGTLESLIEQMKGPLPEVLIRRYSRQLLEAVRELHEHGIAHRDIKSESNSFLFPNSLSSFAPLSLSLSSRSMPLSLALYISPSLTILLRSTLIKLTGFVLIDEKYNFLNLDICQFLFALIFFL